MNKHILPKFLIITVTILCVLCPVGLLFAKEAVLGSEADEDLYTLQTQARQYREEGLKYQNIGDLSEARSLYQKAIVLDPNYAVAYNDLGIIYEATGFPELAMESYLRSIKIDPAYLSAYTNMALFYEAQRDLDRAVFYWAKRAELGSMDDPWTQKAASRFKDIRMVLSNRPAADAREENVLGLIKDVSTYKSAFNKADRALAQAHLRKAEQNYKKKKLSLAIKEALEAQDLDQSSMEIKDFIEKIDLEPGSAAAYNDLGGIYEAASLPKQAEVSYLKALKLNPTLSSSYVNIALFYEKQRDLEKAKSYWAKMAELGSLDDPWTKKAANRVKDIRTVLSNSPLADSREDDVLGLMKDVTTNKSKNDKALAQDHFQKAKQSFKKGDLAAAIKQALDAQYLDQNNEEIEAFIEKAELRALSR